MQIFLGLITIHQHCCAKVYSLKKLDKIGSHTVKILLNLFGQLLERLPKLPPQVFAQMEPQVRTQSLLALAEPQADLAAAARLAATPVSVSLRPRSIALLKADYLVEAEELAVRQRQAQAARSIPAATAVRLVLDSPVAAAVRPLERLRTVATERQRTPTVLAAWHLQAAVLADEDRYQPSTTRTQARPPVAVAAVERTAVDSPRQEPQAASRSHIPRTPRFRLRSRFAGDKSNTPPESAFRLRESESRSQHHEDQPCHRYMEADRQASPPQRKQKWKPQRLRTWLRRLDARSITPASQRRGRTSTAQVRRH